MGRAQSLLAQPSSFVPKQSRGAGSKFKLTLQGSIIRQMPAIQETWTMSQCQQGTELGAGLLTALVTGYCTPQGLGCTWGFWQNVLAGDHDVPGHGSVKVHGSAQGLGSLCYLLWRESQKELQQLRHWLKESSGLLPFQKKASFVCGDRGCVGWWCFIFVLVWEWNMRRLMC